VTPQLLAVYKKAVMTVYVVPEKSHINMAEGCVDKRGTFDKAISEDNLERIVGEVLISD